MSVDVGDTVAVVAFTTRRTVVLFEQHQAGPGRMVAELPGGLLDADETPIEAAARELAEQTGHRAAALFPAGWEWNGADSTRRTHVVIAADCERTDEPQSVPSEMGIVREIPDDALIPHLLEGNLSDAGEAMRGLHVFARTAVPGPHLAPLRRRVRALLDPDAAPAPPPGPTSAWSARVGEVWEAADRDRPDRLRAAMTALVAERATDDPEALFERASVEDFLGDEAAAIPLYRAALEAGLADPLRSQAVIQLASSLRNVGDASGAIALLRGLPEDDPLAPAAGGFLALALHDDDKPTPALRAAVAALATQAPMYGRALAEYAGALHAPARIRVVSVALLVRDGWVLAEEYAATAARGAFLRAPGGGVQVGETAEEAVHREVREELGAGMEDAVLLGVTENIFQNESRLGHELVHVFAVRSAALEALPRDSRLPVLDGDTTVGWYRIDDLQRGGLPLYPPGLLDLARGQG